MMNLSSATSESSFCIYFLSEVHIPQSSFQNVAPVCHIGELGLSVSQSVFAYLMFLIYNVYHSTTHLPPYFVNVCVFVKINNFIQFLFCMNEIKLVLKYIILLFIFILQSLQCHNMLLML